MALTFCSLSGFVSFPTTLTNKSSSSSSPLLFTAHSQAKVPTLRRFVISAAATPNPEATTTAAKSEPKGIRKPRPISPAMQELLGVSEIPRTQALKQIWAYIKQHNLQDPENKKIIVCDEKLKKIFAGKDRVGFLEISGLLNPHFIK